MIRIPLLYPDPNLSTVGTAVFYLLYGLGIFTLFQVVRAYSRNGDQVEVFMYMIAAVSTLVVLLIYSVWFHPW